MLFLKSLNDIDYNDVIAFCGKYSEGIKVEYKANFDRNVKRKIPKVVSSFANSYGGILVIGVNTENGVPVKPFEGFEKPEREEIELTIENLCLSNIYPQILPSVQVRDVRDSNNIFVVVEVPESSNAPHAIENTTKVYVRTGNQSTPYELAELERLETLIKKRNRADLIKKSILKKYQQFESDFHEKIQNHIVPTITVVTHPLFLQHTISDLQTTYLSARQFLFNQENLFIFGNTLNRFQGGVFSKYHNSDSNLFGFNYCGEYGEVIFHKSIELRRPQRSGPYSTDNDRSYIFLTELLRVTADNLNFTNYYYGRCNYKGDVQVTIKLNNVLDRYMYLTGAWRETDNYSFEQSVIGYSNFSTTSVASELAEIIADAFYKVLWAFNQNWDSLNISAVTTMVQEFLSSNYKLNTLL